MKTCLTYIVLLLICLNQGKAQRYISHFQIVKSDSAIAIFEVIRVGCKNYKEIEVLKLDNSIPAEQPPAQRSSQGRNKPVFAFHGNILYNFNFRSYIDTPFSEKNISQHIIQTKINGVYKETFPFTVILTTHKSNSSYYLDGSNVSIQFRQNEMIDNFKKDILNRIENVLSEKFLTLTPSQIYHLENSENSSIKNEIFSEVSSTGLQNKKHQEILENTKELYKKYKNQVASLNMSQKFYSKLSDAQESVEEKERNIQNKNRESLDSAISANIKIPKNKSELYENKRQKTDSLKREVIKSENELKTFQKRIKDSLQDLKKEVWKISKREDLISYLQKTDNSAGSISGVQKILLSINQVGIGRTWIDYSELTVSNISLSGFNVEANPGKLYVAAAAGKVNYKFQGYILKNKFEEARQSLSLVRLGFGKKDKNNIIFTYYTGKKALQNQVISGDSGLVQQISGISVEATASIDENNYLVAEYARSESPALKGKILDLKTNANEAFCLKLFSRFRSTAITSYYRRAGQNFQSFTMLPSNSKQDSWMIRANQQLYKSYILVDAAIRKNDFVNPAALPDLSNKNIFTSIQITGRIPKYPFITIGFYPSSQLTLSNKNVLYENRYNTLNALISHSYNFKRLSMNTNASYMRFYNSGKDSGFIYFNSTTFSLNHSISLLKFVLQGTFSIISQLALNQIVLEPAATYRLKRTLFVTGGIRWSSLNKKETFWGGSAALNLYLKKVGMFQFKYDKIYIPGYNKNLLPVDIGKFTFSREF